MAGSSMTDRPRILLASFSPLVRDARVLRHLHVLKDLGSVTTLGYGPMPDGAQDHLEVDGHLPSLPQTPTGVLALATHRHGTAELAAPALRAGLSLVATRSFDLVVANDARALPLAFAVTPNPPVWADMHEWAPDERSHVLAWRLLVQPFAEHLCREYLPRCAAVTTVNSSIADLYARGFGVTCSVIRNAARYRPDLAPTPASYPIRLVHSGAAVPGRNIESLIDAVAANDVTLDLYLLPGGDDGRYLRTLTARARSVGRVAFREPVAPAHLPVMLNRYDIGTLNFPPIHTNARLSLPNKTFDYVQARLGIVSGPTCEVASLIEEYGLGLVARGFATPDYAEAIASLTPEAVTGYKLNADEAAKALGGEHDEAAIRDIVARALDE